SRQRLSQEEYVRFDIFIVTGEESSGSGNSGLNFIRYQKYVICSAERRTGSEITLIGYIHSGLSLYRFHQKGGHVLVFRQNLFQGHGIIVIDADKPRGIGAEILFCVFIIGK